MILCDVKLLIIIHVIDNTVVLVCIDAYWL